MRQLTSPRRSFCGYGDLPGTGKTPFVAACRAVGKGASIVHQAEPGTKQFTLKEISAWNAKYIRPESSVLTDGLNCFPGVTASGCIHDKVVTYEDGRYTNGGVFKWLNIILGNVKNALHGTYHAISGRHLPRYSGNFVHSRQLPGMAPE